MKDANMTRRQLLETAAVMGMTVLGAGLLGGCAGRSESSSAASSSSSLGTGSSSAQTPASSEAAPARAAARTVWMPMRSFARLDGKASKRRRLMVTAASAAQP